jgi:hypothetical protein
MRSGHAAIFRSTAGRRKHRGGVPPAPGQLSGETAARTAWSERYVAPRMRAVGLARFMLWTFLLRRA